MSRPSYVAGDQQTWSSPTIGPYRCNLCDGRMVIDVSAAAVAARPAGQDRTCTCTSPGKRPAIEHAQGCPRRARRTVPLSYASAADQLGLNDAPSSPSSPVPDEVRELRRTLADLERHRRGVLENASYEADDRPGFSSGRALGLGEAIDELCRALREDGVL